MSSRGNGIEGLLYLLVGGPIVLMWGLRKLREKRLMENIATSKVRSAAIGLIELSGIARPRVIQKAPVSQRDCCWWNCEVQELRSSGKSSRWVTLRSMGSHDLFYLDDLTGKVLINPLNADLRVLSETTALNAATRTQLAPVLQGWGLNDMNWFGGMKRMRLVEQSIPDGAPLYIMGQLVSTGESSGDQRARLMAHLRAAKADARLMTAADLNKDGQVDPAEWDALRAEQEEVFYKEELARQANTPTEALTLVQAPTDGHPYVISTGSESDVIGSLRWKAPLGLVAGITMSGLGVWWALAQHWNPMLIVGLVGAGCMVGLFLKQFKFNWRGKL